MIKASLTRSNLVRTNVAGFLLIVCGIVTMANASSQLSSLLPSEVNGWKAISNDSIYNSTTLYNYIDGGAELYLSYGFKEVINRTYRKQGQPDMVVDIFDMANSRNAFGVFTQSMERMDKSFGQGAQVSKGMVLFWKDRYYVSIVAHPESDESKKAIAALASLIDGSIANEGPLPAIIDLLPEQLLVRGSIRYFRHHAWINAHYFIADHNLLHIDDTTEAVLAKYGDGPRRSLLLLVEYPQAPKAQQAYSDFVKSYLKDMPAQGTVQIEDGSWTACRLSGKLFMAVFNAPQSEDATYLLEAAEKRSIMKRGERNGNIQQNKKGVSER